MQDRRIVALAGFLGAFTVAWGALGAHVLRAHLDGYQTEIFEKGVQYQFYHVLALLAVAAFADAIPTRIRNRVVGLWLAGVLMFSGSLYLLACRSLLPLDVSWAGPVTPLGGLCFIAGWVQLGLTAMRR
jgi:uncharacterized membrane protein YgdD (TMEM256/DUF423 family)